MLRINAVLASSLSRRPTAAAPLDRGRVSLASRAIPSPRAGRRRRRLDAAVRSLRRPPSAASIASRRLPTATSRMPGIAGAHRAAGARGTIARSNPSRAASRSRRSSPATGAQLAEQADLADRDRPGVDRAVAERRGEGQRERQVEAGLGDRQAAGEVRVDVVAAEADPGAPAEHGEEQREPVRVDAATRGGAGVA